MNEPADQVLFLLAAAIAALIMLMVLSGCVSFPIPPTGDNAGKYGSIQVRYVPPSFSDFFAAVNKPLPKTKGYNK
jgi:hypothetical protein